MLSEEDLQAARRIAEWNLAHGSVLAALTAACGALERACTQACRSPSEASFAVLRQAGYDLARVAAEALRGPWAGVPRFDDPRRRGLECYRQAGELAGAFNPVDPDDDRADSAAALLSQGLQITSQATAFGAGLLHRIQHSALK